MNVFKVKGHEPSLLPDGTFRLVFSDEFDGTVLDRTKWDFRLSMMQKKWMSWTDSEKALFLDGESHAVFKIIEEEGNLRCAQLQTGFNFMDQPVEASKFGTEFLQWPVGKLQKSKYLHRYGYYECRCRLQQKPGWWSAFWLQSPIIGSSDDPKLSGCEVDVMESFRPGEIKPHNVFTGGYGFDTRRQKMGGGMTHSTDEFHRYGVLWEPGKYTFYVDGEEDGSTETDVSGVPTFILVSTEVYGYRREDHQPIPAAYEALDDSFVVDYVRVFDRVE